MSRRQSERPTPQISGQQVVKPLGTLTPSMSSSPPRCSGTAPPRPPNATTSRRKVSRRISNSRRSSDAPGQAGPGAACSQFGHIYFVIEATRLKTGLKCRNSQITSMLRCVSASTRGGQLHVGEVEHTDGRRPVRRSFRDTGPAPRCSREAHLHPVPAGRRAMRCGSTASRRRAVMVRP
jgi:hypothetical protein